jgi:hypothetical protein
MLIVLLALLAQDRPRVVVSNAAAEAVFDLGGGSFVSFKLKQNPINPLRWLGPADENAINRPMAHFLCLDRWGQPSDAEIKNGMPYHGEATRVRWTAAGPGGMSASLPMAGLDVARRVLIDPSAALLTVSETVTNRNKLGKLYNMVQHPTIGPPFLDEDTIVDANARRGFAQSSPMPNPEEPSFYWPQALKDTESVDMRRLRNDPMPNVVSYVVDEPIGWATASSGKSGLLIGYVWRTADYPWFNAWRHVDGEGRPLARGLEFGTTGLHQPFSVLVRKGQIFGRPIYAYLDAGETVTRSYVAFLLAIPANWRGVERMVVGAGKITVFERGSSRQVEVLGTPRW